MVNYYELLSIPQNADKVTIEQAVRKTRRLWNNRANNPDPSIRAEAELHVKEIADAEKILLDASKRQEYDVQLSQAPLYDMAETTVSETDPNWEDEYFKAYEQDVNDYAAEIARREIQINERNGRAWFLYGEALRRNGNLADGIDALKRASLFLDDAGVYRQLGFAYRACSQYEDAYQAFKKATQLDASDYEYHYLAANCLRLMGKISDAIVEARAAYSMNPDNEDARLEYFGVLYDDAMRAMSYNRSSGRHLIINKKQLDYINSILKIMATIVPNDECQADIEEIAKIVVDAESIKGGGFLRAGKIGYEYNYEVSNSDTRSTGLH